MPANPSFAQLAAPTFLRLAVGVTFIMAGAAKLASNTEYKGQDAAILANLGVGIAPTRSMAPPPASPPTKLAPPNALPLPNKPKASTPTYEGSPALGYQSSTPPAAATKPRPQPEKPKLQPAPPAGLPLIAPPVAAPALITLPPSGKYTAADFPEPVRTKQAYRVAILLVHAAYPGQGGERNAPMAIWPGKFGNDPWAVYLAFAVGITELACGVLVLVGFFTRLGGLGLAFVMLVALWLTQIGPAIQSGDTFLGLLPNRDWSDGAAWSMFLTQLTLMMSSLALAMLGGGGLSIDRAMAAVSSAAKGGGGGDDDESPGKASKA